MPSGRARTRETVLRRAALAAAALVILALLFLVTGHWIVALVLGVVAAALIWAFRQARSVR